MYNLKKCTIFPDILKTLWTCGEHSKNSKIILFPMPVSQHHEFLLSPHCLILYISLVSCSQTLYPTTTPAEGSGVRIYIKLFHSPEFQGNCNFACIAYGVGADVIICTHLIK